MRMTLVEILRSYVEIETGYSLTDEELAALRQGLTQNIANVEALSKTGGTMAQQAAIRFQSGARLWKANPRRCRNYNRSQLKSMLF